LQANNKKENKVNIAVLLTFLFLLKL